MSDPTENHLPMTIGLLVSGAAFPMIFICLYCWGASGEGVWLDRVKLSQRRRDRGSLSLLRGENTFSNHIYWYAITKVFEYHTETGQTDLTIEDADRDVYKFVAAIPTVSNAETRMAGLPELTGTSDTSSSTTPESTDDALNYRQVDP